MARFAPGFARRAHSSLIVGVRAGAAGNHRFIGIWTVVVAGRIFARSWDRRTGGWYDRLRHDPLGAIRVGSLTRLMRARPVGAARLLDAVDAAYAKKYHTPGFQHYVRGFRTARRRAATVEFLPR